MHMNYSKTANIINNYSHIYKSDQQYFVRAILRISTAISTIDSSLYIITF